MSDFSLDDILDKYGQKGRAGSTPDADDILSDILGEKPARKSGGTTDPYVDVFGRGSKPPSVDETARRKQQEFEEKRLLEEKRRAEFEERQRLAEERKRAEQELKRVLEEKKREEAEARRRAEEENKKRAELEKQQKAERENRRKERNDLIQGVIDEKERRIRRNVDEKKRREQEEKQRREREAEEKKRILEEEAARALDEESRRIKAEEDERKRRAEEESERRYATQSVVVQDAPIQIPAESDQTKPPDGSAPTTEELELEKTLRAQKIQIDSQKLLIKESELEDPEDFLNSINPYEFGKKSEYTQQIETISAQGLSGDTRGVDSNELRELLQNSKAENDADTRSIERIVGAETRVMPDFEQKTGQYQLDPDGTFELSDDIKEFIPKTRETTKPIRSAEEERILRAVNDTIEQKRISDIQDTNPASAYDTGPFDKIVIPTVSVGLESDGGSVLRTGEIPMSDPELAERKLKELASKRKRRLSNFVLEDISDDDIDFYDDSAEPETVDDDAGIWSDLVETQKSLRLRFVLLLIVTAALVGIDIVQRLFIQQKIGAFGNEVGLLDPKGLVFANLIGGVIGMVLCASVMTSGLAKLFRLRADCDSVCAVSCSLSLIATVLHLTDTNDLQQGRAFMYISVAMIGLLFNSVGKLSMIARAKRNFRFISSNASNYYAEVVDGQSEASAFTKGVLSELPYLVTMRKTELFTDFLKKSYCEDMADRVSRRLVPLALVIGLVTGLLVYFIPNGTEINGVNVLDNNFYWASSVFVAIVNVMSPFSMMFMVNNPFKRASRKLLKHGSALLGYTSAEEFGETNSVIVDASTLFPKSAVECTNIKPCKLQNSINNISLDQAIILAASLAVSSESVLSSLLFDMIGGNKDMLVKIDGCVYEDNLGVMGWYENKRLILGSREHMKSHSIKIPEMSAIAKYSRNGSDSVYLAVGGELAVIFFIRLTANPAVRAEIKELTDRGVSVVLKTTDSLITNGRISDLFDIDPERIKIIGASLHKLYGEVTAYTPSGCGALACTGSFVSLAKGINASKKLLKDVSVSRATVILGVVVGALVMIFFAFSANTFVFSPEAIIGWNLLWLVIMLILQSLRKY